MWSLDMCCRAAFQLRHCERARYQQSLPCETGHHLHRARDVTVGRQVDVVCRLSEVLSAFSLCLQLPRHVTRT